MKKNMKKSRVSTLIPPQVFTGKLHERASFVAPEGRKQSF